MFGHKNVKSSVSVILEDHKPLTEAFLFQQDFLVIFFKRKYFVFQRLSYTSIYSTYQSCQQDKAFKNDYSIKWSNMKTFKHAQNSFCIDSIESVCLVCLLFPITEMNNVLYISNFGDKSINEHFQTVLCVMVTSLNVISVIKFIKVDTESVFAFP